MSTAFQRQQTAEWLQRNWLLTGRTVFVREKGRDLTNYDNSPMTKAPTPTENSEKQRDNIKNATKTLITQRLWTDLGRSVGVTAVTPLMWFNRFTSAQPAH